MMHSVTHFIQHASPLLIYLIVALVLLLESSGVPIANTTLLLFTGAMASLGHLDIVPLTIAAVSGSVAGACLAYFIGERGGRGILRRGAAFLRIDERKLQMVERWFQHSGLWMIFFSRMVPYVRPFACFPAGMSRMPLPQFGFAASAGSFVWCLSVLAVAWSLGNRWRLALHVLQAYTLPAVIGLVLLITAYMLVMFM
ncbi:MAG: DedA family protein, partial [Ktedonobacteraceae bacterium]|nr:DedA family protein [Ktedonobacteraceae bacterium]